MNITAIFAYTACFGAEKANLEVLSLLKALGNELTLIVRHDIPQELQTRIANEKLESLKVRWGPDYLGFKNPMVDYFKTLYRMITVSNYLFRLNRERKIDVLYVPNYLQFFFVWLYLFFSKKKTIFRVGDIPSRGLAHLLMWKFFVDPRVTRYVCNSEYGKSRLLKLIGVEYESKVRVIRNIYKEPLEKNAKTLVDNVLTQCLFVGQLNRSKGAHIAIQAAIKICKLNKNVNFLFVGQDISGDQLIKNLISGIYEDDDLNSRIHFCGYVTHDEVKSYYLTAHVLIVPSMFEDSSPNVVIEGRTIGLPVVAFPAGGISELIVHKKTGYLCNESSVEALIEGIGTIISSPEAYANFSKQSLAMPSEFQPKFIKKAWSRVFEPLN